MYLLTNIYLLAIKACPFLSYRPLNKLLIRTGAIAPISSGHVYLRRSRLGLLANIILLQICHRKFTEFFSLHLYI